MVKGDLLSESESWRKNGRAEKTLYKKNSAIFGRLVQISNDQVSMSVAGGEQDGSAG